MGKSKVRVKAGRKRKRSVKRGGLFQPAKHKDLARIVTFESVEDAKRAARKLKQMFQNARTCKRKLVIYRATQYAANRARAGAKNPKFSPQTKRKWREVAEIYEDAAEWMEKRYGTTCKTR